MNERKDSQRLLTADNSAQLNHRFGCDERPQGGDEKKQYIQYVYV